MADEEGFMLLPRGGVIAAAGSVEQREHWPLLMRVLGLGISCWDGLLVGLLGRDIISVLLMIMMMIGLWPGVDKAINYYRDGKVFFSHFVHTFYRRFWISKYR